MKTDFDKKLVKGARLYLVRRYDGGSYLVSLRSSYREFSLYTDVILEYARGERKNEMVCVSNNDLSSHNSMNEVYLVVEEF